MSSRSSCDLYCPPVGTAALIFDCDGTLADTMPLHYQAWHATIKEYGHDYPESVFYSLAGMPTHRIMHLLNDRYGYNLPVEQAAQRKTELFISLIPQTQPIEPVAQVVRRYAGKLPLAIATGESPAICRQTLSTVGLFTYFNTIVTSEDVLHPKPAPDIFLEAAFRLGVDPEKCVAFEDGEFGLQAAREAGMMAVDIRPWRALNAE